MTDGGNAASVLYRMEIGGQTTMRFDDGGKGHKLPPYVSGDAPATFD